MIVTIHRSLGAHVIDRVNQFSCDVEENVPMSKLDGLTTAFHAGSENTPVRTMTFWDRGSQPNDTTTVRHVYLECATGVIEIMTNYGVSACNDRGFELHRR